MTNAELLDPVESGRNFNSVMSKDRFDFLLNYSDDKTTRDEQKINDMFTPVRNG